jgi:hypothetical protein
MFEAGVVSDFGKRPIIHGSWMNRIYDWIAQHYFAIDRLVAPLAMTWTFTRPHLPDRS